MCPFASGCLFHDCLRPGAVCVDLVSVCDRVEIYIRPVVCPRSCARPRTCVDRRRLSIGVALIFTPTAYAAMSPFTDFFLYPALAVYIGMMTHQFWLLFHPTPCHGPGCIQPTMQRDNRLDLRCFLLSDGADVVPLWNATDVNPDESLDASFPLPVPPGLRTGVLSELWLLFELRHAGSPKGEPPLAATSVNVVKQYALRERSTARPLLDDFTHAGGSGSSSGSGGSNAVAATSSSTSVSPDLAPADRHGRHPHFIYG